MKRFFLSALVVVFMAASVGTAGAAGKPLELKIQTAYANASMYYKTLERTKQYIETLSQNRIKVELYADGAVVKSPEIFDSVSMGIVNGGSCWTHWASGKHPAGILFSAPPGGNGMGFDQVSLMSWYWEGGGHALLNEYYQQFAKLNIVAWTIMPQGPEPFGWFNKQYTTVAEINKVKFRSPPGIPAEVYKELGMPVVSMPGGEIVPAAQRGVIDAGEWIGPAEDLTMGFASVWKHYYLQGLHQVVAIGDIYLNKKWYDALPADLKQIIEISIKATVADQYHSNISLHSKALETLVRDQGVILEETPAEYYPAYMAAAKKVIAKYLTDPFFKKVYDAQLAWAKQTVPYQMRVNGLYYQMGKTAMADGVVTDYK